MAPFFFWLTLFLAACDWFFVIQKRTRIRWITKPGTLLALIAWFSFAGSWQGPMFWFGLGLVFSFLGDAILLLPGRFFPVGGAAFLVTHLFYIIGFLTAAPLQASTLLSSVIFLSAGLFSTTVHLAGVALPEMRKRIPQVAPFIYGGAILTMTLASFSTFFRSDWLLPASTLCSLGAVLFLISDSVLGYVRFKHSIPLNDLIVMATYHAGQILIVSGVLINFT